MADDSNRRRGPRRREAALFVGSDQEPLPFGRTRDLSLTGILLETEARPAIGETREITIAWGDETYACTARIVRHTDYGVALEFVDPDTFFTEALHEIIAASQPVDIVSGR